VTISSEIETAYSAEFSESEIAMLWAMLRSVEPKLDMLFEYHSIKNKIGLLWDLVREQATDR